MGKRDAKYKKTLVTGCIGAVVSVEGRTVGIEFTQFPAELRGIGEFHRGAGMGLHSCGHPEIHSDNLFCPGTRADGVHRSRSFSAKDRKEALRLAAKIVRVLRGFNRKASDDGNLVEKIVLEKDLENFTARTLVGYLDRKIDRLMVEVEAAQWI